jgi:hypothetical protein
MYTTSVFAVGEGQRREGIWPAFFLGNVYEVDTSKWKLQDIDKEKTLQKIP